MRFGKAVGYRILLGWIGFVFACFALASPSPVKLTMSQSLSELMTEIRYEDREPEQPAYLSRILILADRMRMDYGQDDQGFILFDRQANTIWHVAPGESRMTGIASGSVKNVWPKAWTLSQETLPSDVGEITQVRLNGALCVEFKSAPLLQKEARLMWDFRRMLAANQANAWAATPEDIRQPCALAIDVREAGVEYSRGLPLAVRYWDGRSRVYQGYDKRAPRSELFDLPAGYTRVVVGGAAQENSERRQPVSSQSR